MTDKSLSVHLENLMGGGLMGNVVNYVLDTVGQDMLYSSRQTRHLFHRFLQSFVTLLLGDFLVTR